MNPKDFVLVPRDELTTLLNIADNIPKRTPAIGTCATVHNFAIEAGTIWELDQRVTEMRMRLLATPSTIDSAIVGTASTPSDHKPDNGVVERLRAALERDRSIVATAVAAVGKAIEGRAWLREAGRGSYAYDDERYQEEFGGALDEISAALDPMRKVARDWSDCPTEWSDIIAARTPSDNGLDPVTVAACAKVADGWAEYYAGSDTGAGAQMERRCDDIAAAIRALSSNPVIAAPPVEDGMTEERVRKSLFEPMESDASYNLQGAVADLQGRFKVNDGGVIERTLERVIEQIEQVRDILSASPSTNVQGEGL